MSGRTIPNIISEKERDIIKQFRKKIPDILDNEYINEYRSHDVWLLQWLRARDLDVKNAELMLRKYMDFRKNRLEGILEWKVPEVIDKHYPVKMSGCDKDGDLICIIPVGKWDFRRIVSLQLSSDLILYAALFFEYVHNYLEEKSTNDRLYTQAVMILDFEGFSFSQLASKESIELMIEFIRLFEDNHPEALKACFIVNAPKIFEILYAFIKPLLTMRTLSKVRIFGSNTKQWRPILLENIDADQLPSPFGGSNTASKDFKTETGFGWSDVKKFPESEMIPVTIEPCMKHFVKFSLSRGAKLSWNFRTTDYDIGFSVLCPPDIKVSEATETKTGELELFRCAHADSHLNLQKGVIVAEKSGSYTLVFDNSFSRFRKKELFYAARVDLPST